MDDGFIASVKKDLEECYEALSSEGLSIEEKEFILKQIQLDKQIVQDHEREIFIPPHEKHHIVDIPIWHLSEPQRRNFELLQRLRE